ncbi:restriction endonuclease [Bacillus mojavensis]|uniref:restriction endonuclease n=1 Tax=Bacillus mojavensis TaxID=72360 RepID=UPI002DB7FCE4|nr:restriction endonuclease [Bacillus mojavensis]MEC1738462.1 restriction endonuclease [Bacillus mojavensis]MEC1795190.1 restriction endonuclease [Bacillus mojavensis]
MRLMSKRKLSETVGWSESGGRRWINYFNDYIPHIKKGNSVLYNESSINVLKIIKQLSESGLTQKEIHHLIREKGIPKDISEISQITKNVNSNLNDIPLSRDIMIPFLQVISDKKSYTSSYINEELTKIFKLTEEQRTRSYENSKDSIFITRIRQVRYGLKKSNYIEEISQSIYQITQSGLSLLNDNQNEIQEEIEDMEEVKDPFEVMTEQFNDIRKELAKSIIQKIKKAHWKKLEYIIVELLVAMGYGDGKITGKTNDGGIDGIIKEDKLGLDNIYLQAKRWDNSIGRELVQSFSGALDDMGAKKGVFITTSHFTKNAIEYAERLQSKKIVLIDGETLAKLMIDYDIGVSVKEKFIIKKIDFSYFDEE